MPPRGHVYVPYDVSIIGGGIAGLYAAHRLLRSRPGLRVALFEGEAAVGGRLATADFGGCRVPLGAGIGRKRKDTLLVALLRELRVPSTEFRVSRRYAAGAEPPPGGMRVTLERLVAMRSRAPGRTFREFGTRVLGAEVYASFVRAMGYTDMEDADAADTLDGYGLDDNTRDAWTGLRIPWSTLVDKLTRSIESRGGEIFTNSPVRGHIRDHGDHCCFRVCIVAPPGLPPCADAVVRSRKVIVTTPIAPLLKLLPPGSRDAYSAVRGQPFLRVYARFEDHASIQAMAHAFPAPTVVPGPLGEVIPVDAKKGVYMIAYVDNANALSHHRRLADSPANRLYWAACLREAAPGGVLDRLEVAGIMSRAWATGTHYYAPHRPGGVDLAKMRAPAPGIRVAGEVIAARHQGWVQGALESVDAVLASISSEVRARA